MRRPYTKDERGVDLKVRVLGSDVRLVDGDEEVFLLLGIDELDRAYLHHVLKLYLASPEGLDLIVGHLRFAVPDNDQGSARSPAIGVDDDVVVELLVGDVDLGRELAAPAHLAHPPDKIARVVYEPDQGAVHKDP